jgi:hypothetical protein
LVSHKHVEDHWYILQLKQLSSLLMGLLAATDEKPYLLKDKQFQMKYKVTIASAIQKAQRRPRLLLAGFSIYPTPHLQPPHETIIKLTEAAGGKVC